MKVKLEEVCVRGASNLKQSDVIGQTGDYPIYGAAGYIGNVNFYHQEKPYVAVVKDGAGIGRTTLHPAKSSVIGTMQYLLPKKNVLPEYLCYVVKYMHLEKYFTGATIPHIYYKDYKKEEFNLDSIEKQKEIIEVLERIEIIIEGRKREITQLDNLIKSRFVEMFGDPVAIIEDGKCEEIQNVTSEINVGFVGESVNEYVESGVPYLRMQNIRPLKIVDDSLIYINEKFHDRIKNANVYTNDVVISRVGINRGMTAVIPEKYNNSSIGNAVIVRADRRFNSVFLAAFITFTFGKHTLIGYSKGSAQGAISVSLVKKWPIPFADIQKQNEFAEFVHQIDKLKSEVLKSLNETQLLMDSLMQEYFG